MTTFIKIKSRKKKSTSPNTANAQELPPLYYTKTNLSSIAHHPIQISQRVHTSSQLELKKECKEHKLTECKLSLKTVSKSNPAHTLQTTDIDKQGSRFWVKFRSSCTYIYNNNNNNNTIKIFKIKKKQLKKLNK